MYTLEPRFNINCRKTLVYCGQHVDDDTVKVCSKPCSENLCAKSASFDVGGSNNSVYCNNQPEDGMVTVGGVVCAMSAAGRGQDGGVANNVETTACTRLDTVRLED